jgi:hypothetical protein
MLFLILNRFAQVTVFTLTLAKLPKELKYQSLIMDAGRIMRSQELVNKNTRTLETTTDTGPSERDTVKEL